MAGLCRLQVEYNNIFYYITMAVTVLLNTLTSSTANLCGTQRKVHATYATVEFL